jgi:CRISPR-associated protein Cmr5
MSNRAQNYLIIAARQVSRVAESDAETANIYGGLCHNFPHLVRSLGLCQARAYYESKTPHKQKSRSQAYSHRLDDVRAITGITASCLSTHAAELPVLEYMQLTRDILDAAIYFKRLAVSILKVENAGNAEED